MAKQVVKLGLEFDTKSAIQSYRNLVSELSKGGADPKAIKQFTSAIEKAETELAQLAAEGSTGFTDSKGIEQYQKKVLKTVTSMQQLALRMQEFSKSGDNFPTSEVKKLEAEIEKLKKKITDAQKAAKEGLVKSLTTNGGFSKKDAEIIAETVKTEEQLIAKLEEEKKLRDEIRKAAQPAAEKATNAIKDKAVARATSGSQIVMDSVGMKGRKGVKAIREAVATSLQEGIKEGWKAEDIKKNALDAMKQAGISEKLAKEFEASFDLKAIEKELKRVNDDIAKSSAVKKYNEANKSYNQVASGSTENYSQFIAKSKEAEKAQEDLATAENQVSQAALNSANAQKKSADSAGQEAIKAEQAANSFIQMSNAEKDSLKSTEALEGGFNRLADRLKYMFGFTAMFNKLRQVIRSTFNDIQELDKAYASIAYVTNETVADLWQTYGEYSGMAEKLGQSTVDVIKASAIYRQQGLDTAEALELTTSTMKLATIAGNDYSTATQEMTAALRGFKMEMDEGSHVSDVYSELAAHAAASVDDIAQAMSRTASIANSAGMSFENTSAFLAQMIETTQESAENIGTSMKTIIARFTELKKNVAGTADSEFDDLDFNKVDQALKSVGVSLKDATGQFRNLDDVFLELSEKWDTLDRNTQRYIATVAAGSRQQSRFIAMMDNYDRTIELINIAADSEGRAEEQFSKAADTIEFKLNVIKTKWEEFKLSVMNSEFMGGILDAVDGLMDHIKNIKMPQAAIVTPFAIMAAKTFILNFIKTIKNASSNFVSIGKIIGQKISQKLPKLKFQADAAQAEKALEQIEDKIKILNTKKDNFIKIKIQSEGNIKTLNNEIDTLKQRLAAVSVELLTTTVNKEELEKEAEELDAAIVKLEQDLQKETQIFKDNEAAIAENNNQRKVQEQQRLTEEANLQKANIRSQATTTALTTVFQSATMALSGYVSGLMTGQQALTGFIHGTIAALGQMVISAASTAVSATIMAKGNQIASLSFKELAVSAGSAVIALWPVALALGAVMLAALALKGIGKWIDIGREARAAATDTVALDGAITALTAKQEKLNEVLKDQTEITKEAKEQYDKLKDGYEDFTEYESLVVKTDEAQENWLQTSKEIAEIVPELIDHYDSEGNAILTNLKGAWEQALEAKRNYYNEQDIAENKTKVALESNQLALDTAKNEKYKKQKEHLENGDYDVIQLLMNNYISDDSFSIDEGHLAYETASGKKYQEGGGALTVSERWKNSDYEDWQLIKDAILAKDLGSKFSITEDTDITEVGQKISDALNDDDENKKLGSLKDAITSYYEQLDKNIAETESTIKTQQKKFENSELQLIQAYANGNKKFSEKDKDIQNIMLNYIKNNLDLNYDDLLKEVDQEIREKNSSWFKDGKLQEKYSEEYALKQQELLNEKLSDYITSDNIDDSIQQITDEELKYLEKIDKKVEAGEMDIVQAVEAILSGYKNGQISADLVTAWKDSNKNSLDALENINNNAISALGYKGNLTSQNGQIQNSASSTSYQTADEAGEFADYFNNLTSVARDALTKEIVKIANDPNKGTTAARIAVDDYAKITKNTNASSEAQTFLLNQDWSTLDAFGAESSILQTLTQDYGMTAEKAEMLFEATKQLKIETGEYNALMSSGDIAIFGEQLDQNINAIKSEADVFKEYLSSGEKTAKITANNYDKINKSLQNLAKNNINIDKDILRWDDATQEYVLDIEKLRSEFARYTTDAEVYIDKQIDGYEKLKKDNGSLTKEEQIQLNALKAKKEEIHGTISATASLLGLTETFTGKIETVSSYIDKMSNAISQFQKDGYVNAESLEKIISIVGKNNIGKYVDENLALNKEALISYVNAKIAELEVENSLTGARSIELLQLKSLRKEMENATKELNQQSEDLQEKHKKALEDFAKAQQDVVDKQKKLNEAIQEYNDLIYGSKNRKSSLDLLYNYKEAISAFSDELTRAKELFEDSSSFDEANKNLDRYLAAAHNSMAEYAAQNEVLKIGLEKRKNNLLNGGTSYEGVNVRFGDYVKIDERTGLAAIDQRLLQEARFADKWKDQLESFVDDYNKYSQELLKNEDAMRKMEKEIQQMRMDATKKWADFEKDIAETLKNEYQEEVNQLKEKYESMKDADDDYLNALQEAIDKQRKLRDKEKKWDDLARKEKKLSLMNRDTSGANQIDRLKMQQEIEQDRESLLDESIDEVIENMGKIYESQQELRDSEIELKEALLDDALYWNLTAQNVSESFTSVDEFLAWSVEHHKEYLEMTDAQKQEFLDQEQQKFDEAIQASAILAKEQISEVTESIQINSEEINRIVETTGEAYINETQRVMNETEDAMRREIQTAIDKINDAKTALDEANQKLLEASQNINQIAGQLANLQVPGYTPVQTFNQNFEPNNDAIISSLRSQAGVDQVDMQTFIGHHSGYESQAREAWLSYVIEHLRNQGISVDYGNGQIIAHNLPLRSDAAKYEITKWVTQLGFQGDASTTSIGGSNPTQDFILKYASGGLVNYTGPAWVDGTPNKPEAFLSAEDTERIGNAAKLLSNIPMLSPTANTNSNNSFGDTNIEINLNIDHISSDVDVDEMLERVKQEIVEVARPIGTNVILQQQV